MITSLDPESDLVVVPGDHRDGVSLFLLLRRRGQVVAVVEEEEELPGLPLRPLLRALLLPVVVEPQRCGKEGAPQRILERLERLSSSPRLTPWTSPNFNLVELAEFRWIIFVDRY